MNRGNAVVDQLRVEIGDIGVSSNGRTLGFEPNYLGSTPRAPTTMRILLTALALAAALSCGPVITTPLPYSPFAHAERVERIDGCVNANCDRWQTYRRTTDPISGPIDFVISARHEACLYDPNPKYPQPRVNDLWTCEWRNQR